MLGLPLIKENFFTRKFIPYAESKITEITNEFLLQNRYVNNFIAFLNIDREKIINKNDLWILLDGGWTHPGWWARECCMYAIDALTGLPIARYYVIKGGNWNGSSKSMEAAAAKKIAEEFHDKGYQITHLIHDKDASTLYHFQKIFPNVEELICTGKKIFVKLKL